METVNLIKDYILPIGGLAAIVFLIIFLSRMTALINKLIKTIDGADDSVALLNKSIEKLQEPLDTVVKVSKSVDGMHDSGSRALKNVKNYVSSNVSVLKNKVHELGKKAEEKDEKSNDL